MKLLCELFERFDFSNSNQDYRDERTSAAKNQITVTLKDVTTTIVECNRVTSLNFPFYFISSRSY